jgi:hypothetical protein
MTRWPPRRLTDQHIAANNAASAYGKTPRSLWAPGQTAGGAPLSMQKHTDRRGARGLDECAFRSPLGDPT